MPLERKTPKKGKQMEMVAGRWQPAGGDDARLDKQVQMVAGACCHPECSVKRALRVALAGGEACERTGEGEWCLFSCTSKECTIGRMHTECFEKLEERMIDFITKFEKRPSFGPEQMRKAMWSSKYDLIRPFCRCACGGGYFKAEGDRSAVARTDADEKTADAKKREVEARLARKAALAETARTALAWYTKYWMCSSESGWRE